MSESKREGKKKKEKRVGGDAQCVPFAYIERSCGDDPCMLSAYVERSLEMIGTCCLHMWRDHMEMISP